MFEYLSQFLDQFINLQYIGILIGALCLVGIWFYYRRQTPQTSPIIPKPTIYVFHLTKCESLQVLQKLDASKYNIEYINCDTPTDPRIKEYTITSVPAIIYKDLDGQVRRFTEGMITLESVTKFITTTPSSTPVEELEQAKVDDVVDEKDDVKIPELNLSFDDDDR